MLALGENCLHPTSNKRYVKSMAGGINNSPEGHAVLFAHPQKSTVTDTCKAPQTHGFVVEFENDEDRDYYLNKDPAHLSFVKDNGPIMNSVKVLDFEPGKF
jgi:TFIIF-interacting CTD phosphatase-like protein